MKIIESVQAHYDTLEVPFGRIYHWHQAHVSLECDCGEKLTFCGSSAITTCIRCGAPYGTLVNDIHYREEHLDDEEVHPVALRSSKPGRSTPTRRSRLS
jgi:hypothetical protein